jgi:hypothetical protein
MVGSGQRTFFQMPIIHYFCEIPPSPAANNYQPHLLAGQNPAEGHAHAFCLEKISVSGGFLGRSHHLIFMDIRLLEKQ